MGKEMNTNPQTFEDCLDLLKYLEELTGNENIRLPHNNREDREFFIFGKTIANLMNYDENEEIEIICGSNARKLYNILQQINYLVPNFSIVPINDEDSFSLLPRGYRYSNLDINITFWENVFSSSFFSCNNLKSNLDGSIHTIVNCDFNIFAIINHIKNKELHLMKNPIILPDYFEIIVEALPYIRNNWKIIDSLVIDLFSKKINEDDKCIICHNGENLSRICPQCKAPVHLMCFETYLEHQKKHNKEAICPHCRYYR